MTDETIHPNDEPTKLHPVERNEAAAASGSSLVEHDESDVTEKIQRLNLYFEKENVRILNLCSHRFRCVVDVCFLSLLTIDIAS